MKKSFLHSIFLLAFILAANAIVGMEIRQNTEEAAEGYNAHGTEESRSVIEENADIKGNLQTLIINTAIFGEREQQEELIQILERFPKHTINYNLQHQETSIPEGERHEISIIDLTQGKPTINNPESFPDINTRFIGGWTVLLLAAYAGLTETVKALLKYGANVTQRLFADDLPEEGLNVSEVALRFQHPDTAQAIHDYIIARALHSPYALLKREITGRNPLFKIYRPTRLPQSEINENNNSLSNQRAGHKRKHDHVDDAAPSSQE